MLDEVYLVVFVQEKAYQTMHVRNTCICQVKHILNNVCICPAIEITYDELDWILCV